MNGQRQEPKPAQQPTPAQLTTAPAHPQPAKSGTASTTPDRPHDDHVHVDEPGYGHGV